MIRMPGTSYRGPLPPLSERERALRDTLRRDVEHLAGRIGERNVWRPEALVAAADFIEAELVAGGYLVKRQEVPTGHMACHNLEVEVAGRERPSEIVLVGAHYDSVIGSPGANDNGSGVAVLLALARGRAGKLAAARSDRPQRTLRFVAFVNEEPPHFQTGSMGSLAYARRSRERNENIVAMLSLETLGYYTDKEGSQQYPFPFGMFYPSTGNFVAFVGNVSSRQLVRQVVGSFRRHAKFPSEGGAVPGGIPGVGWSDHWAFWQEGYSALMVTDTAPFRYPFYHTSEDTPEKVDYDRLARVTAGLAAVIDDLVNDAQ